MKRLLTFNFRLSTFIAAMLLACCMLTGCVKDKDIEEPVKLCYILSEIDSTASVTHKDLSVYPDNYKGLKNVVIPEYVDPNSTRYLVTHIDGSAFERCYTLESVTLPKSVYYIDHSVFSHCRNLTSFTFPRSIKYMGWSVFAGSGLKSVKFEWGMTSLPHSTFAGCGSLETVDFSEFTQSTLITIEEEAFRECYGLERIIIPEYVTTIEDKAFDRCKMLRHICCMAETPPACGDDVFKEIHQPCTLYVPVRSIPDYQQAEVWKDFPVIKSSDSWPLK